MAVPASRLVRVLRTFARPREFTFRAILQPQRFARRFRLVRGLLTELPRGRLSRTTRKDLRDEIEDAIKESPFIEPFLEERTREAREIEKEAREAAKEVESAVDRWIREITGG